MARHQRRNTTRRRFGIGLALAGGLLAGGSLGAAPMASEGSVAKAVTISVAGAGAGIAMMNRGVMMAGRAARDQNNQRPPRNSR